METNPITIFWLVVIGVVIVIFIIFWWWLYRLQEPKPGKDCSKSGWLWDSSCMYIQETAPDSSLQSPENLNLFLLSFSYSSSMGKSYFLPVWYRFRYVNTKTGGYSPYSAWTKNPVISGSCCLPCENGNGSCPPEVSTACNTNRPELAITADDSQYNPTTPQSDGSFIYLNLHRYVGSSYTDRNPPDDTVEDEIIGTLQPKYLDGVQYYSWPDIVGVCSTGCTTPTWCQGGSCLSCNE